MEPGERHADAPATMQHGAPAMPRRRFIALAVNGAAGLACLPTAAATAAASAAGNTLASPGLLAMFGSKRLVRELGERYRQLVPAESDAESLIRSIAPPSTQMEPADVGSWLARQVQQDFAAGRTVTVGGWVLGVTEARQCALYSLQGA